MNFPPWERADFEILCAIDGGKGSFGTVWKAKQVGFPQKEYAIKRINVRNTLLQFNGDIHKLHREVDILQNLSHDNVVHCYFAWFEGEDVVEGRYVCPF